MVGRWGANRKANIRISHQPGSSQFETGRLYLILDLEQILRGGLFEGRGVFRGGGLIEAIQFSSRRDNHLPFILY